MFLYTMQKACRETSLFFFLQGPELWAWPRAIVNRSYWFESIRPLSQSRK